MTILPLSLLQAKHKLKPVSVLTEKFKQEPKTPLSSGQSTTDIKAKQTQDTLFYTIQRFSRLTPHCRLPIGPAPLCI